MPTDAGRRPRRAPAWAGVLPAVLVVGVLLGAAVVGMVRTSLGVTRREGWAAADLGAYRALLSDPAFWESVAFTLRIALVATLASAALGLALAAALRRCGPVTRLLAALPVPVPHLVAAVVAVVWLGPGGVADRLLGGLPVDLVRDPAGLGVTLVYVAKETPFLALLVLASWTPAVAAREEAAATLGAGPVRRMAWVVWPAVRAPLVAGAAAVAAFVIGALEVPLVIGPTSPETLAELSLTATRTATLEGRAEAAAILVVATLFALAAAAAAAAALRGRRA